MPETGLGFRTGRAKVAKAKAEETKAKAKVSKARARAKVNPMPETASLPKTGRGNRTAWEKTGPEVCRRMQQSVG